MKNNFVGLIILDGFGLNKNKFGNAIKIANPTNLNYYFNNFPYTTLHASGEYVGLPEGQIGNSEVGHLNIGAGKIIMQSLQKINQSIKNKSFFNNHALLKAVNHAKQNNSALHLIGLTSTGGVHSHLNHLFALIDLAKQEGLKNVYIHVITDGRDTLRNSGIDYVKCLSEKLEGTNYKIATVMGRFYAMDRENNYDRTQKAYNAMVYGISEFTNTSAEQAILNSYQKEIYDEFIEPVVILQNNKPVATINENDSIIFFNYREDRARQLTKALVEDNFKEFNVKKFNNVILSSFTRYDATFKKPYVAFEKDYVKENLSEVISKNGLKQFKITETTKYAHVTYFLNGGIEEAYPNEDRFLIETLKVERFDQVPKMRAEEITQKAIELIKTNKYNFMVLNYSNCDMVGHTGNLNAAVEAVKVIDREIKKLVDAILSINGVAIITADHGNAEEMLDKNNNVLTDHTTNKVPFAIVGKNVSHLTLKQKGGVLSDIAPTVLHLLGIEKPKSFENKSLIKQD